MNRKQKPRFGLEILEDRCTPATFIVGSLGDTGAEGEFRDAIRQANRSPGEDTIEFDVVGTISLFAELPKIEDSLIIAGPGADQLMIRRDPNSPQQFGILDVDKDLTAEIHGITIAEGSALDDHGGIRIREGATVTIVDSVIRDNVSASDPGGIRNEGTLTVLRSTISGNVGETGGIENEGILIVEATTISGNVARGGFEGGEGEGGGIRSEEGAVTIINSTISGNQATGSGGGIRAQDTRLSIELTTITDNRADTDEDGDDDPEGGGLRVDDDTLATVRNSIIAGNFRRADIPDDVRGILAGDSGFNVIGGDPGLGSLADNGGPTLTHLPLASSPASNAGDPNAESLPQSDQRGFPRVLGGRVDVGSVEADGGSTVPPTTPSPTPPPPTTSPPTPGESGSLQVVAVAGDLGSAPTVTVFNPDGSPRLQLSVFDDSFRGGVRVVVGDVNGDGTPDVISAAGPGGVPLVRVFDGLSGDEIRGFLAFEESFTGGVFVASADFDRDGFSDIVVSPDVTGGPRVRVLSGRDGSTLSDFFGIEDPNFRGGARAAASDIDRDGLPDLLVGAGFGGGPRVAVFSGSGVSGGTTVKLFPDFFVFEPTLRNGIFPSIGDLDGDDFGDLVFGAGPGGGPRVIALDGEELLSSEGRDFFFLANFFAGDLTARNGVRVTVKDLDFDDRLDLVVGPGTGDGSSALIFLDDDLDDDRPELEFEFEFEDANDDNSGPGHGLFVG